MNNLTNSTHFSQIKSVLCATWNWIHPLTFVTLSVKQLKKEICYHSQKHIVSREKEGLSIYIYSNELLDQLDNLQTQNTRIFIQKEGANAVQCFGFKGWKLNQHWKPHGIMAKVLDRGFKASEFKLQSSCNVHFWTNTLGKGMNLHIPPAMG